MTMNKDDDREVGWARTRIEQLQEAVIDLRNSMRSMRSNQAEEARAIDSVSEELAGTDKAVDRINQRLTALEGAWSEGDPVMGERLSKLENSFTRAVQVLNERFYGLEQGVASLSEQGNADRDRVNQVVGRNGGLFEAQDAVAAPKDKPFVPVDRLGPFTDWERGVPGATPDGRVAPVGEFKDGAIHPDPEHPKVKLSMQSQTPSGRIARAVAIRQEAYDRGYSAGLAAAQQDGVSVVKATRDHTLAEVEVRVRSFMSDHFSTATIDEIIAVIRAAR